MKPHAKCSFQNTNGKVPPCNAFLFSGSFACVQKRLRAPFSEHLAIAIDWHTSTLEKAMELLIKQDEALHWVSASGKAPRLDSARSLMLEARKQSDNALPVISQSTTCVHMFMEGLASVLKVCRTAALRSSSPQETIVCLQHLPGMRAYKEETDSARLQAYAAKLDTQVPPLRHSELTLLTVRSVCCLAATSAFFLENIPHLHCFILERCPDVAAEEVSLAAAAAPFEALTSSCLKVLDTGLFTALTRFVDGPLLPGAGIQVMVSNVAAWKMDQVCHLPLCHLPLLHVPGNRPNKTVFVE